MADPKEYRDEKDKRSPGLLMPEPGGFKLESGGSKGLYASEVRGPCEFGRLEVFSRSGKTAESPNRLSSVVPSNPDSPSLGSMALAKLVGRRELAGLYIEEGFVRGGGIEMLALPILPPTVPTSANRLFRLGGVALLVFGGKKSEWEGRRPVAAREGAGLEESIGDGDGDGGAGLSVVCLCASSSSSWSSSGDAEMGTGN